MFLSLCVDAYDFLCLFFIIEHGRCAAICYGARLDGVGGTGVGRGDGGFWGFWGSFVGIEY